MINLVKALRRLRISRYLYPLLRPLAHQTVDYSADIVSQSDNFLQRISPDLGQSALCHNLIEADPRYDLQIVIPAYKVEKYIAACIDSILGQATSYRYIIYIINDGSPDRTRKILEQYEGREEIVIIDQENKGFSGARNTGLARICARYVMFVDSDDYLDSPRAIQDLLDCAYQHDADIVEGGYRLFYGDKTLLHCNRQDVVGEQAHTYGFPWGKVYKSKLWENVHFPENYWFEDTVNEFLIVPSAGKIANISTCVYAYRKNLKGVSVSAYHNVRTLDCLWITRRLTAERLAAGLGDTPQAYTALLSQIAVNQRRLENLGRQDILRAAFIIHKSIVETYYPDATFEPANTLCRELAVALRNNDFAAYRLTTLLL